MGALSQACSVLPFLKESGGGGTSAGVAEEAGAAAAAADAGAGAAAVRLASDMMGTSSSLRAGG